MCVCARGGLRSLGQDLANYHQPAGMPRPCLTLEDGTRVYHELTGMLCQFQGDPPSKGSVMHCGMLLDGHIPLM